MSVSSPAALLDIVTRYYALISAFETDPAAFADLLHPEIEHREYPNAVTPRLTTHGLAEMMRGAAAGKSLLASQHFGIERSHACPPYGVLSPSVSNAVPIRKATKSPTTGASQQSRQRLGRGETLIVEGTWEAVIGTARGPFAPGMQLRAWLCVVFEFEDGLIRRQRNYDCYEPFGSRE